MQHIEIDIVFVSWSNVTQSSEECHEMKIKKYQKLKKNTTCYFLRINHFHKIINNKLLSS